jgi:glutamate dehydrogenase
LKDTVIKLMQREGSIHPSLLNEEVEWFFNHMGIDPVYFDTTPPTEIANHIAIIYAGKILARNENKDYDFSLRQEGSDQSFFVCRSVLNSNKSMSIQLEENIEAQYMHAGDHTKLKPKTDVPYRLKVFRTVDSIVDDMDIQLRFYMLNRPSYALTGEEAKDVRDIDLVGDKTFLNRVSKRSKDTFQEVMDGVLDGGKPVVKVFQSVPEERVLLFGYMDGTLNNIFSTITDIYHERKMYSQKKYVEHFSNGVTVIRCDLRPNHTRLDKPWSAEEFDQEVEKMIDDLYLFAMLPRTGLHKLYQNGVLTAKEVGYGAMCWKFAHQFLSREYTSLMKNITSNTDPSAVLRLKQSLRKNTYTEDRVLAAIEQYPELIKLLYADFQTRFAPTAENHERAAAAAAAGNLPDLDLSSVEQWIYRSVRSEFDIQILSAMINLNKHILKTNFFNRGSSALCFRLDPRFLSSDEYPVTPYGVFCVLGGEFRGFHCRFEDVARGGIRIIRSANPQVYAQNVGSVFDENYNLASTQQAKNKDIPEGGSKGTIFLQQYQQDKSFVAFKKYIDALLDVILIPVAKKNTSIVDYYGKEEILFFGPDEGTADYMDWASQHAHKRGAHFWNAITTGKSTSLGGIPHDMYGMTTRSIHQYVLGVLSKLGLKEDDITKFQTGGPDGDLGSNEIKISKDKTIGIVDGSGVLFDPQGLNRQELARLAKARSMVHGFDKSKLGPKGFFVDVEDRDRTLPDGEVVPNGLVFRNRFHESQRVVADLFVPCGGRPASIDAINVSTLFDAEKKPRFKIIVEGANLFITQEARLNLEKKGVILFKDAAANKGGVTSSSLEVLAALSLSDAEFDELMQVKDPEHPPEFYKQYVKEVQDIIENNARMEFECIWNEHSKTKQPRSVISDALSARINRLNTALKTSSLYDDIEMRKKVIAHACPQVLVQKIGADALVKRIPANYQQAIFGAHLASTFIYRYGLQPDEFAFFDFIDKYVKEF